jgi:hypothetical protein
MNRIIIGAVFTWLLYSCSGSLEKEVLLPNGTNISGSRIRDIEKQYDLQYFQYEGFKGITDDTILRNFVIVTNKQPGDIISDNEIEKLKDDVVTGIVFDKIPESTITFDSLISYVGRVYNVDSVHRGTDSAVFIRNGNPICLVTFFNFGIPGYIVRAP